MITSQMLTRESLTVIIDNGAQVIPVRSDHPKWKEILDAVKSKNEFQLLNLLSMKAVVSTYSHGELTIDGSGVLYRGRPLHGVDVDRVLSFLNEGLPYEPYAKYLEKKMKNPSARAIEEMYPFLEHKNMSLTPDGNFIAYKGVQDNYYSVMGNLSTVVLSGTVDSGGHILNEVGAMIEVERSSVDDNFNNGCSFGLHVGSLIYAKGWGARTLLVEIDPADVVSVPSDCNCQKLRCCKYKVIGEYTGPLPNTYTNEFSPSVPAVNSEEPNVEPTDNSTYEADGDEDEFDEFDPNYGDVEKDHYTPLNPPPAATTVEKEENTPVTLDKTDYVSGWNAGFDDHLLELPSAYLQGDDIGADSEKHAEYIRGYLAGYSV